jgi:hypothetical protein
LFEKPYSKAGRPRIPGITNGVGGSDLAISLTFGRTNLKLSWAALRSSLTLHPMAGKIAGKTRLTTWL